jgi:hypothetical protein
MTIYQERRFYFKGKKHIEYWADIDYGVYLQVHESQRRVLYTAPAADLAEMCDRQYIAGLQAGFRLGDAGDNEGLRKATANYRQQIIDSRKATTPAAILRNIEEAK